MDHATAGEATPTTYGDHQEFAVERLPAAYSVGARTSPASTPGLADSPITKLRFIRVQLDEALAASTVSPHQIQMIEEATHDHMHAYPAWPPAVLLTGIAADCTEVITLSRRRQPAAVQSRLSGCAALLATLCADALMRLGEAADARSWYRTAVVAADDNALTSLRVLVRAQAAMLPYYFGNPHRAVELTNEALALSAASCSSRALAAAGRARALARIGAHSEARVASDEARSEFDQAGDDDSDAAFRFSAKRLLFYLSGAAAWSHHWPHLNAPGSS